jgi:hypothetical protein
LLSESRSELPHRHFDVAGAASVTTGLMLLVYALTRASQDGWGTATTIGLLSGSAVLLLAFVVIELRSAAPLLPMQIFRLRTLAAANAAAVAVAAIGFSQFFLLTLYMQQVLHYSAVQTGVAFVATTLTIVAFSNVAQTLVTRLGPRWVLTAGLLLTGVALGAFARMPVHGHYFWDMFPPFLLSGVGLALSFVPMTIAGLTGVRPADAGIASGLINTSRQIGGAVGLAAVSTIAAAYTTQGVRQVAGAQVAAGSLTHGFQAAFYALTGLAAVGALIAAVFIEPRPQTAELTTFATEQADPLEEAA